MGKKGVGKIQAFFIRHADAYRHLTRYVTNFFSEAVNLSYGMPICISMTEQGKCHLSPRAG